MNPAHKTIDPRTTRRTVDAAKFRRDSALYSTYEAIGTTTVGSRPAVVLQRKPEFCAHCDNPVAAIN